VCARFASCCAQLCKRVDLSVSQALFHGVGLQLMLCLCTTTIGVYWVPHNSEHEHGDPFNDLFHPVSGSVMCHPLQKKRYSKAKRLGKLKPSFRNQLDREVPGAATLDEQVYIQKWIPKNKRVFLKADAVEVPTNLDEYVCVVAVFCFDCTGPNVAGGHVH